MPEKKEEETFSQDVIDYEMVDFEESDARDILKILKLGDTTSDKLNFTVFTSNIAFTSFLAGYSPQSFYIFHTFKTLILLPYRWYAYKKIRNHYFMFDFCYYTNLLLLIYLWSPWQLGFLFPILFVLSNGPLLWSVFLWRNSIVPHSVDKMTSLVLHVSPAVTVWGLRWHSTKEQGFQLCANADPSNSRCGSIGWRELLLYPILCSLIWVLLYYIVILVWRAERIKQRQYVNSYTYLVENAKKKLLSKIFDMFGPQHRRIMYLVWHTIYILVSISVAYYGYFWQLYNSVLIFLNVVIASFNGASFYIDVIGKLYYSQKKEEKEL